MADRNELPEGPDPAARRFPVRLRVAVAAGTAGLAIAATAAYLVARPWQHAAAPSAAGSRYTCHLTSTADRWQAGLSSTETAVLRPGAAGSDVAEAQCLLQRAGYSPGKVDGIYGEVTERAVKRFQTASGLAADGAIGPHTWRALREVTSRRGG